VAGICAALLALAAGAGVGGYLALRSHDDSEAIARTDAAALQAAKDCVAATNAPDTTAMRVELVAHIGGAYRSLCGVEDGQNVGL
jgi:hypothetical protein